MILFLLTTHNPVWFQIEVIFLSNFNTNFFFNIAVPHYYLYVFSKGERRIRVHTLCLPVVSTLNEVFLGADVQAISGLLANMGKNYYLL